MKRIIMLVCAILLVGALACAETAIDLGSMSEEELLALRAEIDERLSEMHSDSVQVEGSSVGDVLYSDHDCRLTLTEIDQRGCKVLIENNSDKNYAFFAYALAINGVMTDCGHFLGYIDISSGKKAYVTIDFYDRSIKYRPETPFNNIHLMFWACDNENAGTYFETEILPVVIDPNVPENSFEMGAVVAEACGLSISPISITDDSITLAVLNNNPYYVDFDLAEASVNGWAFNARTSVFDVRVFPGCQAIAVVNIDEDFRKECSIESVDTFEFKLGIWEAGDYSNERMTPAITFDK